MTNEICTPTFLDEPITPSAEFLAGLAEKGECVTVCYNQATVWQSRSMAMEFYTEAAYMCEGCERDRYMNVCFELAEGNAVCWDGVTEVLVLDTDYR